MNNNNEIYPSKSKKHLSGTSILERNPIIPGFLSVSQVLDFLFKFQGKHDVINCMDLIVNTSEFVKDAELLSEVFLELGIKPGDIVCCSMPNYYQALLTFKAANRIGAITTFLNPIANENEIFEYLNEYECKVFLNCNKQDDYNEKVKKNTNVNYIISLDEKLVNDRDFGKVANSDYSDIINFNGIKNIGLNKNRIINTSFGGKQDALILYTSGSTGKAKSMLFTNENLISALIYLKNSTHVPTVTEDDKRWMNVVPFMYPYGFVSSTLAPIMCGREVILSPNINPENISYYFSKNPNAVFGSPAFLNMVEKYLPKNQSTEATKLFISGGDFLSSQKSLEAIEFFKQHGSKKISIANGSGNGEILGCCTNAMNIEYKPDTVGQLVVGPEYLIVDPETKQEVPYGTPGVICVRGKHVFKGYYKNEELTKETKITINGKEYYYTGNYGILSEDRYFTLLGRASRFYITNTLNKVYCELIQMVGASIDAINECVVVPKPNDDTLYESKAYIKLNPGFEANDNTIEYILNEFKKPFFDKERNSYIYLKDYEIPKSITFVDQIPRNVNSDKINYELLKNLAEQEYSDEKKTQKKLIK